MKMEKFKKIIGSEIFKMLIIDNNIQILKTCASTRPFCERGNECKLTYGGQCMHNLSRIAAYDQRRVSRISQAYRARKKKLTKKIFAHIGASALGKVRLPNYWAAARHNDREHIHKKALSTVSLIYIYIYMNGADADMRSIISV